MTPSLEGWPTKAKEAPCPHDEKTDPARHQPSILISRGETLKCMLTGLKVSSLACKCVFYRLEHNTKGGMKLNFEGLNIRKWYIPTYRVPK